MTTETHQHTMPHAPVTKETETVTATIKENELEENLFTINGSVAPGFERVYEAFKNNFKLGLEDCAQCCVYVKGQLVVDLWGGLNNDSGFDYKADSIQNVFSSTKAITSLVIAMLVDRGHLSYEQLVIDVFPEYGEHNKHTTTIAHIMRHEAGLSKFKTQYNLENLQTDNIKLGQFSNAVSSEQPHHIPGNKRVYHAITRGFILNEIVRRVDPLKRTIGEFCRDEIAVPLEISKELYIGVPEEEHTRIRPIMKKTREDYKSQLWSNPKNEPTVGRLISAALIYALPIQQRISKFIGHDRHPFVIEEKRLESEEGWELECGFWNQTLVRKAEIPSANGHCSARALALLAACICNKGVITLANGKEIRLISEQGIENSHGNKNKKKMFWNYMTFNNAGWCHFEEKREGYVGWMGYGGSAFQWEFENEIGFGYAMNALELSPLNVKAYELQKLAKECAVNLKS